MTKITIYKNENKYKKHKKTEEYIFVCYICNNKYATKYYLDNHIKLHDDPDVYSCNFSGCEKKYKSQSRLKNHINSHTTVHKCTICDNTFSDNYNLSKHIKKHKICDNDFDRIIPIQYINNDLHIQCLISQIKETQYLNRELHEKIRAESAYNNYELLEKQCNQLFQGMLNTENIQTEQPISHVLENTGNITINNNIYHILNEWNEWNGNSL